MKKGDKIYTPRFCTVQIEEVFQSEREAREAGYTNNTYYEGGGFAVFGKTINSYQMEFAAAKI